MNSIIPALPNLTNDISHFACEGMSKDQIVRTMCGRSTLTREFIVAIVEVYFAGVEDGSSGCVEFCEDDRVVAVGRYT